MTSMTGRRGEPTAQATAVTVVLVDLAVPNTEALQAALTALPAAGRTTWQLLHADTIPVGTLVHVAVCDTPATVLTAVERWPNATVIALVPAGDNAPAVVAALSAGPHVCVSGHAVSLIAARVVSVARRGGVLVEEGAR